MPKPITDSLLLKTPPPIHATDRVILTPASYVSWAAMWAAHPTKLDYLLTPGDYTSWGSLDAAGVAGTAERPRTFRYYNPTDDSVHPVDRVNQALISGISFSAGANYWMFIGLTNRNRVDYWTIRDLTYNCTFHECLIENCANSYAIRVFGSYVTVQRCVIRSSNIAFGVDSIGVQFKPVTHEQIDCMVLDCEIYDYGDPIAFTEASFPQDHWNGATGIIEGNDCYLTSAKHLPGGLGDGENGIDIKNGHDTLPIIVRNNRLWGFRANGVSSVGDCMVLHFFARNTIIEDNIFGEAPGGVREKIWPPGSLVEPDLTVEQAAQPRNITVRNNQFYNIQEYRATGDYAAAFQLALDALIEGNTASRCSFFIDMPWGAYVGGPPTFIDNTLIAVGSVFTAATTLAGQAPWDVNEVTIVAGLTAGEAWDTYERKRFTGPEWVIGALRTSASASRSLGGPGSSKNYASVSAVKAGR